MGCILIVEDNDDLRNSLRDLLLFHGHRLEVCAYPAEATPLLVRLKPDAAIIDIRLPKSRGMKLARRLKQDMPDTYVVAVSASLDRWVEDDLIRTGADLFLEKPFDSDQLCSALNEALREKPLSAAAAEVPSPVKDSVPTSETPDLPRNGLISG